MFAFLRKRPVETTAVPEVPLGIAANDYVQCTHWQIAECPIKEGGVYQVLSVNGGRLQFRQCERDHDPQWFMKVVRPGQQRFEPYMKVHVRTNAVIDDHVCTLARERFYRVGQVDDFNRIWFYHQGCDNWHDPEHFVRVVDGDQC